MLQTQKPPSSFESGGSPSHPSSLKSGSSTIHRKLMIIGLIGKVTKSGGAFSVICLRMFKTLSSLLSRPLATEA